MKGLNGAYVHRAFVCGAYVYGAFVHGAYDWRACVRGASVPASTIRIGEIESSTLTTPPWSRINLVPEFPDVIKHEKKVPTSLPSIIFVALPSRVSRLHCGYIKNLVFRLVHFLPAYPLRWFLNNTLRSVIVAQLKVSKIWNQFTTDTGTMAVWSSPVFDVEIVTLTYAP